MNRTNKSIQVHGARVHNLQNINVTIPWNQLTVITGPSGSGKSSLAYDTLHAEGQRRYLDVLRYQHRSLVQFLKRPDVDSIVHLPNTLCVSQQTSTPHPRSTLATITELHDLFRLLWARLGIPHCPNCGNAISRQTIQQIMGKVKNLGEGCKLMVLAPLVQNAIGDHQETIADIRQAGFMRARIDGQVYDLQDLPKISKKQRHSIDMIVDRLIVRDNIDDRLRDSLSTAERYGNHRLTIMELTDSGHKDHTFSTIFACSQCGLSMKPPESRNFSFNSPYGACSTCRGLGIVESMDREALLPNPDMTLTDLCNYWQERLGDAVTIPKIKPKMLQQWQSQFPDQPKYDIKTPVAQWSVEMRKFVFDGNHEAKPKHPGLAKMVENALQSDHETIIDARLSELLIETTCPDCAGTRLNPQSRHVLLSGRNLPEVLANTVDQCIEVFIDLATEFSGDETQRAILERVIPEIHKRLKFLQQVGLGYLTLDRAGKTLSGGELRRARLATQLGTGLLGVCYILDEPTTGLHASDTDQLLTAIRELQQQGNTVILVEHDDAVIRAADYLIDIGPGAGSSGGNIMAAGDKNDVIEKVLVRETQSAMPRQSANNQHHIYLQDVKKHNLKNLAIRIPLENLLCITGVSGSGKSTLIYDVLVPAVRNHLRGKNHQCDHFGQIDGLEHIDKLIDVNQAPLGRSNRSNPASYTGIYTELRQLFARTKIAKMRGYKPSRFSVNVKGGRCESCQGSGLRKLASDIMPDLQIPCPVCQGQRFDRATLEVRYKGFSMSDVLNMPIETAAEIFANVPRVNAMLAALIDIGVGYIALGQPAPTLSGGEAQRIKLAAELGKSKTGKTLLILDEPTSGMHYDDVARLIVVLRNLVAAGNSVIVIEHNLQLIASADWLIDMGPGAGDRGGQVVWQGPPQQITPTEISATSRYLHEYMNHSTN